MSIPLLRSCLLSASCLFLVEGIIAPLSYADATRIQPDTVYVDWSDTSLDWRIDFDDDLLWRKVTPVGNIVLVTEAEMLGIAPHDGSTMWRIDTLRSPGSYRYATIRNTPLALIKDAEVNVNGKKTTTTLCLNVISGEIMWGIGDFELQKLHKYLPINEIGLLVLYGDKSIWPFAKTLVAVDMISGELVWENPNFFGERRVEGDLPPTWISDSVMALFWTVEGPMKFNPATGEVLAQIAPKPKKLKNATRAPSKGEGHAPLTMDYDSDVLYSPFDKHICAINTRSFTHLWTELPKFQGPVSQVEVTPHGLLVRSTKEGEDKVTLVDLENGENIWSYKLKKGNSTNFLLQEEKVLIFAGKSLYCVDLQSGVESVVCDNAEFKRGETAEVLEAYEGGYLVYSSLNAIWINPDGHVLQQCYSDYGKKSFLSKLGDLALVTALNASEYYEARLASRQMAQYNALKNRGKGRGYASYELRNPMAAFYEGYPDLPIRLDASKQDHTYLYVPVDVKTSQGKKMAIAKVPKQGGPVVAFAFWHKEPSYHIDTFANRVFVFYRDALKCFRF